MFKFCIPWEYQVRLLGARRETEPLFCERMLKLRCAPCQKSKSYGRQQYMQSQMPHGGFNSLWEWILGTALTDPIKSSIPDTETHTDREHWPHTVHGQTVFRMVSDTERRANLGPNLHHKPTLSYAMCNWQWSICHSSSVCAQSIQHESSLQLTDSKSSLINSLQRCNSCFQNGEDRSSNSVPNGLMLHNKSFVSLKNMCLKFLAEEQSCV